MKKEIKGRKTNTQKKKTIAKTNTTKSIKKRVTPKNSKVDNNIKLACTLGVIAILLVAYMIMGLAFTAIAAIGILMIIAFGMLLKKTKNQKRKRKILNIILIFILTIGILGLISFSAFLIYIKQQADPLFKEENLNTKEISRLYDKDGKEFAKLGSQKEKKLVMMNYQKS